MKKFRFSLERMLGYKDTLLTREKEKLLALRQRKNEVDEKIASNERQISETDAERVERAAAGMTIAQMQAYNYQITSARGLLKQLAVEQKIWEGRVENQLKVVVELSQEVSGLEKLREKQLEEYNYLAQKEEALQISELVSTKYINDMAAQDQAATG